ncbi:hypothetical protein CEXT_33851 [Caerostris extrusa]|uniref:Uncharacterized protein n=1 Tax=Caerostris extrusa TaxID=172846 RepID=A0AAV4N212_CAEEX|nr:hypothetical protein CEXT_33851 [Caerostris extrusa]
MFLFFFPSLFVRHTEVENPIRSLKGFSLIKVGIVTESDHCRDFCVCSSTVQVYSEDGNGFGFTTFFFLRDFKG